MNIFLKDSSGKTDLSEKVQATIEIDEQLDTSLDSGTIKYLTTEENNKGLNEALAGYSVVTEDIVTDDGTIDGLQFDFVGIDSRALVRREENGQSIYSHQVALTEPSKLLQGVLIDGFGVTQPEEQYGRTVAIESNIRMIPSWSASGIIYGQPKIVEIINVRIIATHNGNASIRVLSSDEYRISYDENNKTISWYVSWYAPNDHYMETDNSIEITYTYPQLSTLENIVERLLQVTPFDGQIFTLTNDVIVRRALQGVVSPEFKWNTQTTLWECLLQVGAVIDAIPRLVADTYGNYTVVTFDFVNAYYKYADSIDDGETNVVGESVDESLYNTALSAVVENLLENE